ncbi:hypothetical protein C0993_007483 [Termitomyces sp. T159_Od127]|nr:hypothetical protein C0993_007483 [Termitomyces sp. T159_Od127]
MELRAAPPTAYHPNQYYKPCPLCRQTVLIDEFIRLHIDHNNEDRANEDAPIVKSLLERLIKLTETEPPSEEESQKWLLDAKKLLQQDKSNNKFKEIQACSKLLGLNSYFRTANRHLCAQRAELEREKTRLNAALDQFEKAQMVLQWAKGVKESDISRHKPLQGRAQSPSNRSEYLPESVYSLESFSQVRNLSKPTHSPGMADHDYNQAEDLLENPDRRRCDYSLRAVYCDPDYCKGKQKMKYEPDRTMDGNVATSAKNLMKHLGKNFNVPFKSKKSKQPSGSRDVAADLFSQNFYPDGSSKSNPPHTNAFSVRRKPVDDYIHHPQNPTSSSGHDIVRPEEPFPR